MLTSFIALYHIRIFFYWRSPTGPSWSTGGGEPARVWRGQAPGWAGLRAGGEGAGPVGAPNFPAQGGAALQPRRPPGGGEQCLRQGQHPADANLHVERRGQRPGEAAHPDALPTQGQPCGSWMDGAWGPCGPAEARAAPPPPPAGAGPQVCQPDLRPVRGPQRAPGHQRVLCPQ